MFSKGLSLLVIGLLYAHQTMAFPENRYYVETQGPIEPNPYGQGFGNGHGNWHGNGRGNGYGHGHGHGFGHGFGHGNHHHREPNFNQPQFGPGPSFGPVRPPYGGVGYDRPPSPPMPFGGPFPNPVQGQDFPRRQPGAIQPRPTGGESTNQFGFNGYQPRPGQDQQPVAGAGGSFNPTQPRPSQGSNNANDPIGNGFQQPRPVQQPEPTSGADDPFKNGFQPPRPVGGGAADQSNINTLQPRPVPGGGSNGFNFQTPPDDQSKNTFQPRPANSQPEEELDFSAPTFKPEYDFRSGPGIPKRDSTDEAINNIFNTETFISPSLKQEPTERDPKTQAGEVPLGERGLFETEQICTKGLVLMAGHCRKPA